MKKNGQKLEDRKQFVKQCISHPETSADIMIKRIKRLKKSKRISETAEILSDIFYLSEKTIFRDYLN